MSSVTLFLPALAACIQTNPDASRTLAGLRELTRRAVKHEATFEGEEHWLARAFDLDPRTTPFASLLAAYDGIDVTSGHWLAAEPVHLAVQGDGLTLWPSAASSLTRDNAAALLASLAPHFAADGVTLIAPHPSRWYARTPHTIATPPPPGAVAGKNIFAFLDALPNGDAVRRWMTEAQMLLHEHPVNTVREAEELPPINSVWFWGGGDTDARPRAAFARVYADGALPCALAQAAAIDALPLPASITPAQFAGDTLIADLSALAAMAVTLKDRDRDWFAPLVAALDAGRLARVNLVTRLDERELRFEATRASWLARAKWAFSKPVSLSEVFA